MAKLPNHVEITPRLLSVMNGLLLSDGCLQRRGTNGTACLRVEQSKKRREWLDLIASELNGFGVTSSIRPTYHKPSRIGKNTTPGGNYDLLRTLGYAEFVDLHGRWYHNKIKVVPRDLRLDAISLCHWFCGDGRGGDKKGTLGLCTDGFSVPDVDFLVARLYEDLGIESIRVLNYKGRPQVLISRQNEAAKMKATILELMPACCTYKLAHVRTRKSTGRGRRIPKSVKKSIAAAKGSGTMRSVAEQHGVSTSKVWTIWHERG